MVGYAFAAPISGSRYPLGAGLTSGLRGAKYGSARGRGPGFSTSLSRCLLKKISSSGSPAILTIGKRTVYRAPSQAGPGNDINAG
jgi:hypothetical protein